MLLLISIFIFLWCILAYLCRRFFLKGLQEFSSSLAIDAERISALNKELLELKEENDRISEEVSSTKALYEMIKNMSHFLEEEKIFAVFKDGLGRYIKVQDYKIFSADNRESLPEGYLKIPLNLESQTMAYLVIKGLSLQDEEKFSVLFAQLLLAVRRANLYAKIQRLAITDALTGAFSRAYSLERFKEELERSLRFKLKFSILMADIDHFKKFNDRYGHLVGDVILKEIVKMIKENLRHVDLVGRYGGEEFLILLPETNKENALVAAERIRRKVQVSPILAYDETIRVTLSIGVSSFPDDGQDQRDLLDKADWALYRSKNTGRNRVSAYSIYR